MKPGGQKAQRAARRRAFHTARLRAAATPSDATHAVIAQARALIAKLPPHQQDDAWKTITRHLIRACKEITDSTSQNTLERSS